MPSFNKVVLIGRLTRDPEMRYTTSGLAVTSFSIAVDRRAKNQQGEKQTDFFRCTAWRQSAEFVSNYASKGRLVAVEGRIELNKFTGQDGVEKQSADIVCDHVEILDSNREQGGGGQSTQAGRADEGNGYFPDDEMGAGPAQARAAAPQGARSATPRPAPAANRPPAQQPQAAYPADDFDDSDPFADE